MYIKEGICYAENETPVLEVCEVKPLDDWSLWVKFNNNVTKVFNCKHLLVYPAFSVLKDNDIFKKVYVEQGVVSWLDGEIDIAPETLYDQGTISYETQDINLYSESINNNGRVAEEIAKYGK